MEKFPDDVTTEILSHLPVIPLLRFRCVSKPFCALIDSPYFVKLHLNRSLKTKTSHKLVILNHSRLDSVGWTSLDQTQEHHHRLKLNCYGRCSKILGSVNGLMCVVKCNQNDIIIWNLGTKRCQRLPDIHFSPSPPLPLYYFAVYGFGYDSVSDDYKFLMLVQFKSIEFNTKAKLYSLRSKSWKMIQDFPYDLTHSGSHGVLVSGSLHWIVSLRESAAHNLIAAFDLATNEYMLVAQPNFPEEREFLLHVWELGGCLCVTCDFNDRVDLWVMSNYGESNSWKKLCSISQQIRFGGIDIVPLAYSGSRDEILLVQGNRKLFGIIQKRAV